MYQYVVYVGVVVMAFGAFFYIRETLRGTTKPNRVTWLVWSIAPLIGTAAALSQGVRLATLPVFMMGFFPLIVFLVSFINKDSYWELKRLDYICGFFSFLALFLWVITRVPEIAIVFAIVSDALAALPTLIKSWKYPETESSMVYSTSLFGAATSFFALNTWSFSEWAFPAYLVLINALIFLVIYRKRFIR